MRKKALFQKETKKTDLERRLGLTLFFRGGKLALLIEASSPHASKASTFGAFPFQGGAEKPGGGRARKGKARK